MLFLGLACLIIEKDFEGSLEGKETSTRGAHWISLPEALGRQQGPGSCHLPFATGILRQQLQPAQCLPAGLDVGMEGAGPGFGTAG